jgi:hypothetical protein
MPEMSSWTNPEKHMVRFHHGQVVAFSITAVALLACTVITAVLIVLMSSGGSAPADSGRTWLVAAVVSVALTAGAFGAKLLAFRSAGADDGLHGVTISTKRGYLAFMILCLLAGIVPCAALLAGGHIVPQLSTVVVPFVAMAAIFPAYDRFVAQVNDLRSSPAAVVID